MATLYPKAEILFPSHLIPHLRDLRGPEWQELVDQVSALPEAHPDRIAFVSLMIRLGGCVDCLGGSYKFMRGCAACARQTIAQFKGTDAELLKSYDKAKKEFRQQLDAQAIKIPAERER